MTSSPLWDSLSHRVGGQHSNAHTQRDQSPMEPVRSVSSAPQPLDGAPPARVSAFPTHPLHGTLRTHPAGPLHHAPEAPLPGNQGGNLLGKLSETVYSLRSAADTEGV